MNIKDMIVSLETQIGSHDSPLLRVSKMQEEGKAVELLTPPVPEFFIRLFKGESFIYRELFKKDHQGQLHHGELSFQPKEVFSRTDLLCISDLALGDISNHSLYSYRPKAKSILRALIGKEVYASFLIINYNSAEKKGETAPLFFLPLEVKLNQSGELTISASSNRLIFNDPLIRRLKTLRDIDISYSAYDFNFKEYKDYVSNLVADALFSISEEPLICALPLEKYLKMNCLLNMRSSLESDSMVSTLLANPTDETKDVAPLKGVKSGVSFVAKIEEELRTSRLFSAVIKNTTVQDIVLKSLVVDRLVVGDSINVYSRREPLRVSALLSELELNDFICRDGEKKNAIMDLVQTNKDLQLDMKDAPASATFENYLSTAEKLEEIFDWNLGVPKEELIERLANYTALGNPKYHFVINSYSRDDFELDTEFFKRFASLPSLNTISFNEHPFYGLTSKADENTYQEIMEAVKKTIEDVDEFSLKLNSSDFPNWGLRQLRTLRDFASFSQHLDLLQEYSGFDLQYFEDDLDAIDIEQLGSLRQAYATVSSVTLAIDNLTKPEFWKMDIKEIKESASGDKKAQRAIKKKLLKTLKIADKKNYVSLLKLIFIYSTAEGEITAATDSFKEQNIVIDGLSDIVAIESAINFRQKIERHLKLYDDIDFKNNEHIARFFSDSAYRDHLTEEVIPPLEDLARRLQFDFDELYSYFDSAEKKDYELMAFEEVGKSLKELKKSSYSSYLDYYNFVLLSEEVSAPLNAVINELIEKQSSFQNLEVDFFLSLFASYGESCFKKAEKLLDRYVALSFEVGSEEMSYFDQDLISQLSFFKSKLKAYLASPTYRAFVREAKRLAMYSDCPRNDLLSRRFGDVIKVCRPLRLLQNPDYLLRDQKCDLSIIIDSADYDPLELIFIAASSRSLLLIDREGSGSLQIGAKTIPYQMVMPQKSFSLDDILDEIRKQSIDPHLLNLLKHHANLMGLKIASNYRFDNAVYPLVVLRPGQEKPLCLLVSDLAVQKNEGTTLRQLFSLVDMVAEMKSRRLPLLPAALNPQTVLSRLLSPHQVKISAPANSEGPTKATITPASRSDYTRQLEVIRGGFSKRNTIGESIRLERSEIEPYLLSLLPLRTEDLNLLPPYMTNSFRSLVDSKKIVLEDNFFLPANLSQVLLRAGDRSLDRVCDLELEHAVFTYISNFSFLPFNTLIQELASVIGIDLKDPDLQSRVKTIIGRMVKERKIQITGKDNLSIYQIQ